MPFLLDASQKYRMPVQFGPTCGPRQPPGGGQFPNRDTPRSTTFWLRFRTEASAIEPYLPPGFRLRGEPFVLVEAGYHTSIGFLAGRGYNTLGVSFPVTHAGRDGETHGNFLSVLWENMAEPILSGREELGFAKIYCELPWFTELDGVFRCRAHWDGHVFLEMTVSDLREGAPPPSPSQGYLHYKYIPRTGSWGEADVAYTTFTPFDAAAHGYESGSKTVSDHVGSGSLTFHAATWQQMPTQFQVVNALAGLPMLGIEGAGRTCTVGSVDLSGQRRLD